MRAFEPLVHATAAHDPVEARAHAQFIATRLLAALLALLAFPVYLALAPDPEPGLVAILLLLMAPVFPAVILSRTGAFAFAVRVSSLISSALIAITVALTGGLASVFLLWAIVVPLEAALARDGKTIVISTAMIGAALLAVAASVGFDQSTADALLVRVPWLPLAMIVGILAYAALTVFLMRIREDDLRRTVDYSSARQRLLSETVTDIVSGHVASGAAVYVSPAISRLLDTPPSAVEGNRWIAHIHPADRDAYRAALGRIAADGAPVCAEFRMRRARLVPVELRDYASDDDYVWVEFHGRPLNENERRETGIDAEIVAVTRDIGVRKTHERGLEDAREEAERASAAKSRFLANVSHELRTPLNAIIGFSEILQNEVFGGLGSDRNREYVGLIHSSGSHLLQLVNDILDMSKIESGKFQIFPEPFDMIALVANCCALMAPEAERKHIALLRDVADSAPDLVADQRACKQILLNLLSNAIKFTENGGRVTVSIAVDGDDMVLGVTDTGIGIAEECLPRLGEPFAQVDNAYNRQHDGTGLGLSVVKGLAELHAGTMSIQSKVGVGTTVRIRLPLEAALPDEESEPEDAVDHGTDKVRLSA